MEQSKDPQAFRAFEFAGWQQSVDAYSDQFAPLTRQSIPAIIDAITPVAGKRVLDVACGPGDLARALATDNADVVAIDFAPAMIERALALNTHPKIQYSIDDAETLVTINAETFDAVVMNYGILHLGQPLQAIQSAARVLKPGGTFVFSCWQDPSKAAGFGVILDAVKEVGATPEGMPHGPNFFEFSENTNIESALRACGFTNVRIRDVDQTWIIDDAGALFKAFLEGTARTGGLLRKLPAADREAVRQIASTLATDRFQTADGHLSIPMPSKVASADLGL